jgi:hypothetical protein
VGACWSDEMMGVIEEQRREMWETDGTAWYGVLEPGCSDKVGTWHARILGSWYMQVAPSKDAFPMHYPGRYGAGLR